MKPYLSLLILLLLPSCSSPTWGVDDTSQIRGKLWIMTDYRDIDGNAFRPDSLQLFSFYLSAGDSARATLGCGSLSTTYRINGSKLNVNPDGLFIGEYCQLENEYLRGIGDALINKLDSTHLEIYTQETHLHFMRFSTH